MYVIHCVGGMFLIPLKIDDFQQSSIFDRECTSGVVDKFFRRQRHVVRARYNIFRAIWINASHESETIKRLDNEVMSLILILLVNIIEIVFEQF